MTGQYTISIVPEMQGAELRRYRERLKLTQAGLADRLGVSANTVARYERAELKIPEPVARLTKLLATRTQPRRERS